MVEHALSHIEQIELEKRRLSEVGEIGPVNEPLGFVPWPEFGTEEYWRGNCTGCLDE